MGFSATVTLGGGREWRVPLILPCADRDPSRVTALPKAFGLVNGRAALLVARDHQPMWDEAVDLAAGRSNDGSID